jgi:hypothetical protein
MTGAGRPTLYRRELCELARNYCLLGATNADLAGFFDVTTRTIDNWIAAHPEFATGPAEEAVNPRGGPGPLKRETSPACLLKAQPS